MLSGVCHLIAERLHFTHRGVCLEVVNTESLSEALYNKSSLEAVDEPLHRRDRGPTLCKILFTSAPREPPALRLTREPPALRITSLSLVLHTLQNRPPLSLFVHTHRARYL